MVSLEVIRIILKWTSHLARLAKGRRLNINNTLNDLDSHAGFLQQVHGNATPGFLMVTERCLDFFPDLWAIERSQELFIYLFSGSGSVGVKENESLV